jgi:hypothetical protein
VACAGGNTHGEQHARKGQPQAGALSRPACRAVMRGRVAG